MNKCDKCETYKQQVEKYKRKYEVAKSGLTQKERDALIELICNEQTKYMVARKEYGSEKYAMLENLKAKIRVL